MNPFKLLAGLAILALGAIALTAAPRARSLRTTGNGDEPMASCADLNTSFDSQRATIQSEEKTISRAEAATLSVQAETNGGLQVVGWDKDSYLVTLCKAARADSDADSVLSKIHLVFQNGELSVSGPPSHDRWTAHLLVKAPKSASLDLRVNNGPMGLFHVDGKVTVQAKNGPVTMNGCTGDLNVTTQNGPVTLEGDSGKLRIEAQNGPVSVSLGGTAWTGSGLEAHANNGPLTLRIPAGYQSGVLVESDGHSPFQCHASVCSEGRKTWEDDHKSIEFGSGPTLVRLSTVNGPISVR
jgi:hypothetical protein